MAQQRQKSIVIRPGGCYVGGPGKEYLTRHVTHIVGDTCYWESYDTRTGEATRDCMACSEGHLYNWAGCEATPEEVARLHKPQPTYREELVAKMQARALLIATDEELIEEVKRRGLWKKGGR